MRAMSASRRLWPVRLLSGQAEVRWAKYKEAQVPAAHMRLLPAKPGPWMPKKHWLHRYKKVKKRTNSYSNLGNRKDSETSYEIKNGDDKRVQIGIIDQKGVAHIEKTPPKSPNEGGSYRRRPTFQCHKCEPCGAPDCGK